MLTAQAGLFHSVRPPKTPAMSKIKPTRPSPKIAPPATPDRFSSILLQALDDDFLLADEIVHHQTELAPFTLGDDQQSFPGVLGFRLDAKDAVQAHDRQRHPYQDRLVAAFDGEDLLRRGSKHFFDREDWNDVPVLADADHKAIDNRQGKREAVIRSGRLCNGGGLNFNPAAQFLERVS